MLKLVLYEAISCKQAQSKMNLQVVNTSQLEVLEKPITIWVIVIHQLENHYISKI